MTADQIIDTITTVGGTLVILARMRNYVTVDEYRTGKAKLHDEINELRVTVAVLKDRKERGDIK